MRILRKAFTLVELLVVISIIALLLAILMPALNAAREQAKITVCRSNLHQMGIGFIAYSSDFKESLPSFPEKDTWGMPWAVGIDFKGYMGDGTGSKNKLIPPDIQKRLAVAKYKLPHKLFYCPSQPLIPDLKGRMVDAWDYYLKGGYDSVQLGYLLWIPRKWGNPAILESPPSIRMNTASYKVWGKPTVEFRAPKKLTDPEARANPLTTDHVGTADATNRTPEKTNVGTGDPLKTGLLNHSVHKKRSRNVLFLSNQVFADGHAEGVPGSQLKPRFSNTFCTFWR